MFPSYAILLIGVVTGAAAVIRPGLKARITPKFVEFANQRAKKELQNYVTHLDLPEQEGDYSSFFGSIHYNVFGLIITKFDIEYIDIKPTYGRGLEVNLRVPYITLYGHWRDELKWMHVGDSGIFYTYVRGVTLRFSVEIGYDGRGRPTVHTETSHCAFHVNGISVTVRGKGKYDWIYNRISGNIEKTIKDKLNKEVCLKLVEEVNTNISEKLRNLKVLHPITKETEIDLRLISKPDIGTSVTTSHKGTVYRTSHHFEPPYNVPVLPYDDDRTKMIFVWITDYVANSACYSLYISGFFQYILTKHNIPPGVDLNLNTSSFQMKFLFPQLSKLFPNRLLQFSMNTIVPPKVTFGVNNVSVFIKGEVVCYVVQENRSLTDVFSLGVMVNVSAKLGNKLTNVTWDKTSISYDLKLLKSSFPDFKIDALKRKLMWPFKVFIVPKLQQMGKMGIPLPSLPFQGYHLRDLNITHGQNFVKIGTNLYHQYRLKDHFSEFKSRIIQLLAPFFLKH